MGTVLIAGGNCGTAGFVGAVWGDTATGCAAGVGAGIAGCGTGVGTEAADVGSAAAVFVAGTGVVAALLDVVWALVSSASKSRTAARSMASRVALSIVEPELVTTGGVCATSVTHVM